MRSDQSRQALRDILENARLARQFAAGLDQSIRDQHPALPWWAIMGSGTVYPT